MFERLKRLARLEKFLCLGSLAKLVGLAMLVR